MPTPVKSSENMSKHMTKAEKSARQEAEASVRPPRDKVKLRPPPWMNRKGPEMKHWKSILKRMEGIDILDDLDAESLGIYCKQLVERETLQEELRLAREASESSKTVLAYSKQLTALDGRISEYAEKLGLTPSGRVRLAQKRAEAAGEDPNGDLFG